METAEIKRRWLQFFGERGHTVVPSASLLARRPQPAVRQRRHGAVQALLPRPGDAAVPARHQRPEVRAHPRHRGGRQDHPARHVLPDERQLLLRRLLQGRRDRAAPGSWSPARRPTGGLGFDPDKVWVTVSTTTTRPRALWRKVAGLPDERIQRRGMADNYWHMGVPGPGGPCSEIYIDRGPGVRPRRRPGRRRGPVPGDLEPRLHAGRARRRSAAKDDFDVLGPLPEQEHRHRHGPRARRLPAAGRRQPLRDRRGLPGPRAGRRAGRQALRRRRPDDGRRAAAGRRRPRPQRA